MPTSDRESVAQTAALLAVRAVAANLSQGSHVAAHDAIELHKLSTQLHRWAERQCGEDLGCKECAGEGSVWPSDQAVSRGAKECVPCRRCAGRGNSLGRREAKAEARCQEIASAYGLRCYFQGDPRGAALYLIPEESVPDQSSEELPTPRQGDGAGLSLATLQARWIDSNYSSTMKPTTYAVFHRTWWKENPSWPNGLEPEAGEKHYLAEGLTFAEAREMCREWCAENEPGRLSDKAEFEEE